MSGIGPQPSSKPNEKMLGAFPPIAVELVTGMEVVELVTGMEVDVTLEIWDVVTAEAVDTREVTLDVRVEDK